MLVKYNDLNWESGLKTPQWFFGTYLKLRDTWGLYRNHLLWAVLQGGWNWAVSCRELAWADGQPPWHLEVLRALYLNPNFLPKLKSKSQKWAVWVMGGMSSRVCWCEQSGMLVAHVIIVSAPVQKIGFWFFFRLCLDLDQMGQGIGTLTWAWQ